MNLTKIGTGSVSSSSSVAIITPPSIDKIGGLKSRHRFNTGVNGKLAVNLDPGDLLKTASISNIDIGDEPISWLIVAKQDGATGYSPLVSLTNTSGTSTTYTMGNSTSGGAFRIACYDSGGFAYRLESTETFSTGKYFAYLVSYDGSEASTGWDLKYANLTDGDTTWSTASLSITAGSTAPLEAGLSDELRVGDGSGGDWDGAIDQIVCIAKSLTTAEENELLNSGTGIKYGDLEGTETYYSSILHWMDFDKPSDFGYDSHGQSSLTLSGIDNTNAVNGIIIGKSINGEVTTRWDDISQEGKILIQETPLNMPKFSDGILFDGSNDGLYVNNSQGDFNFIHNGIGGSIAVSFNGSIGASERIILCNASLNTHIGFVFKINASNNLECVIFNSSGTVVVSGELNVSSLLDGLTRIVAFFDYENIEGTNFLNIYANDLSGSYTSSSEQPSLSNANTNMQMGSYNNTSVFNSTIFESLTYDTVLSDRQRKGIEKEMLEAS